MMDKKEKFKLTLKEIVDKHGRESMVNGRGIKGLLMDYIPDCVAERNLLLSAIRLDIPRVLIRPSNMEINTNKAITILKEELFVNDNAAVFIVDAIAYSLGVNIVFPEMARNSTSNEENYNQNKVNTTNNKGRIINLHNPEYNKNQNSVFPAQNIEELRKKYARAKAELDLADSYLKKAELSKRVAQERFNSSYSSNRNILKGILDRKTQGLDQAILDYQKALQNFQIAEEKYNKAFQSSESVCPCCKELNPNSAKFCHNCGTRIKK